MQTPDEIAFDIAGVPAPKVSKRTSKKKKAPAEKRNKYQLTKSIIGGGEFKSVRHELIRRLGGDASIFLMELVFQFETTSERDLIDGYFLLSRTKAATNYIFEKLGFSYHKQKTIRDNLKALGLIDFKQGHWNNQLMFSVDVEAIKALIEDEKRATGNGLSDQRFNRALRKSPPVSYKICKTVLGKSKDGLTKNERPIIEKPLETLRIVLSQKNQRKRANARLGDSLHNKKTDPANVVEFELKFKKWKKRIEENITQEQSGTAQEQDGTTQHQDGTPTQQGEAAAAADEEQWVQDLIRITDPTGKYADPAQACAAVIADQKPCATLWDAM